MNVLPTNISDVHLIEMDRFSDERGSLTKIYTATSFAEVGLPTHFPEHFYSTSKQGTIRGMHVQKAHAECGKFIVYDGLKLIIIDYRGFWRLVQMVTSIIYRRIPLIGKKS